MEVSRQVLLRETKFYGFSFSAASMEELLRQIHHGQGNWKQVVRNLCNQLKEIGSPPLVEISILQLALKGLSTSAKDHTYLQTLSAFSVPRFVFNQTRGTFLPYSGPLSLLGSAEDKLLMFKDRYDLLHQRCLRNELFCKQSYDLKHSKSRIVLTPISSLEGTSHATTVTVMGMLTQADECVILEDPTGSVQATINPATSYTPGFFVNGATVVAQGNFSENMFHIVALGLPPAESRERSTAAFTQTTDLVGFTEDSCDQHPDALLVVLHDVHLDLQPVVQSLRRLLTGFSSCDASLLHFIFVGNFSSVPVTTGDVVPGATSSLTMDRQRYVHLFDKFGDLVAEFPEVANKAKFVLVPGPSDPTTGDFILPQAPLMTSTVAHLRRKVANLQLSSNPCRLQFCKTHVVIYRDDIYQKLRRHTILPPKDEAEPYHHLVKTIVDQAHLSPVPLYVTPIYWAFDHSLRLFPLPHLAVLCDNTDAWETEYNDSSFVNPGSFAKSGTFLTMSLNSGHQLQQVPT
eukprot:TRINITY_DN98447_c0_g1_i1.p1 TRINITY_DN98447_c0_g1~~TRINITY_DN98447_c0_g1_i1.p1  ORF type:complete len:525 (-),score=52.66 TRINITY_DN98447_c0_g1_i1:66-1616(-)